MLRKHACCLLSFHKKNVCYLVTYNFSPMELVKEVKVDTRRIMVNTINAMGLSDVEQTLIEEGRWDALRGQIIQSIITKHLEVNVTKLRHMVDSAARNMVKCAQDLGQDMPKGVDMSKLEIWRLRWRARARKAKEGELDR